MWVCFACRLRLEEMQLIYNEDLSPGTPPQQDGLFQCFYGMAACGTAATQKDSDYYGLAPSRLSYTCYLCLNSI